jgi:hypothetical protein
MCVAHRVFSDDDSDFGFVLSDIRARSQRLVIGGQLLREFVRDRHVRSILLELDRRGSAKIIPAPVVDNETAIVQREGTCVSNDPHVIALARVSGARLLCTIDENLIRDFKNRQLIRPRGRIYRNRSHRKLLRSVCRLCL